MRTPSNQELERSRQATISALRQIDESTLIKLSRLTLPEIRALRQEVARVLPAGNLPAFVLSGLVKLKGRHVEPAQVRKDVTTLMRGISLLPQGLYSLFVVGPAAVLYAYQQLLQLAGKDLSSAFPEGTWQFYLQFGLREDTAWHASENIALHRALPPNPDPVEMAAAMLYAVLETLYQYDHLLAMDWEERVTLRLLEEILTAEEEAKDSPSQAPISAWNARRPYHVPLEGDGRDYLTYRRETFREFLHEQLATLPPSTQEQLQQRYQARASKELAAYQDQMTILATLEPDKYQEQRRPLALWQAHVAFIWRDQVYLLPACQKDEHGSPLCYPFTSVIPQPLYRLTEGTLCDAQRRPVVVNRSGEVRYRDDGRPLGVLRPPTPGAVKSWVAAIQRYSQQEDDRICADLLLASAPRAIQQSLRTGLPPDVQAGLAGLRTAPIVVNWDLRPANQPLSHIRQARRGVGDHAMTIFRTERSLVYTQSHIFFDGLWSMAVMEIMTQAAARWYHRSISRLGAASPGRFAPIPLPLAVSSDIAHRIREHIRPGEAAAESQGVDLPSLSRLRKWLRQRGVRLTVNDFLVLYRSLHASRYELSPRMRQELAAFRERHRSPEAEAALQSINETLARFRHTNPALLIPMDASNVAPKERVFPTTFRNPLVDIEERLGVVQERLQEYHAHPHPAQWQPFDQARRELLAYLKAFGELMDALKGVTMRGESFNTATIRLLAHLPSSMQQVLDQIPQRIGILNEIIKGNEVFSNVGRVAPGSAIVRFISAKDDGATKELVWGIVTDDTGCMHISLRDFRPFVPMLLALGEQPLADLLAWDYLESYVQGINHFVADLSAVAAERISTNGQNE